MFRALATLTTEVEAKDVRYARSFPFFPHLVGDKLLDAPAVGNQKVKVHVDGDDTGPDKRQGEHEALQDSGLAAVFRPQHGLGHHADASPARAQSTESILAEVNCRDVLLQIKHRLSQLLWQTELESRR